MLIPFREPSYSNWFFMRANRILRPVFVLGCPRSGTTVVGACLAAHSALGGGDESLFLTQLAQIYYNLFRGHNWRNWAPLRSFITDEKDLVQALGAFADEVFTRLLARTNKTRYVDHTPSYAYLVDFIDLLYPDAAFFHIIRDGRYVVESLTNSYERGFLWAGETLSQRTELWVSTIKAARRSALRLGNTRYREISYEEFCRAPENVLEQMLTFLGLAMEPAVLKPLAQSHANPLRRDPALAETDASGNLILKPKTMQNGWPAQWTETEKNQFVKIGGQLLNSLGYDIQRV